MNLEDFRREYLKSGLRRADLNPDPLLQFEHWLQQAIASGIYDPTAMTLATVDNQGQPSQRIVLLKKYDVDGFIFFTNYNSAKAAHIATNRKVSLHFPWHPIDRQVCISGEAEKISTTESLRYFLTRPRNSQLAAWASQQSHGLNSRAVLMRQFEAMKSKFKQGEVPLPDFWGGFRVKPSRYEFWQGRGDRLHDRFEYRLFDEGWGIQRLSP